LRDWRADPSFGFPAPLRSRPLRWWPPDILTWQGLTLDQLLTVAELLASRRPPAGPDDRPAGPRHGPGRRPAGEGGS
jgi:hypothetical protein